MFDAAAYLSEMEARLKERFGPRLAYIGLQGSYLRGEATDASDIDVMVLIDNLSPDDLAAYRQIMLSLPDPDKSCGFICSTGSMRRWNRLEVCQLVHTTKDICGCLADFVPAWTMDDEKQFVALSIGNLYHELAHRLVHRGPEISAQKLPGTAKALFFILQNLHFVETGVFCKTKAELLSCLQDEDAAVLRLALGDGECYDHNEAFARILAWCESALCRL